MDSKRFIKADYIWLDGTHPTQNMRSKIKVMPKPAELSLASFEDWGFDGSSTYQATGHDSDLSLKPVSYYPDPTRGENYYLVLCEVFNPDGTPHSTNSRARLREALEANKEILGITAHDLKNPLAGIIGLAEMILADADDGSASESVAENLPMLKGEAERMLKIVQDLLDSHRQGEELPLRIERTKLTDIISTVLRWNSQQAQHKEIVLGCDVALDVQVNVDVLAMQRVLDNYVSNAIKYSPQGTSVCVQAEIESCAIPQVRVTVRDEGPGLTESDKAKAFGKLQRLSAKPTGGEHSTGLGLFIVKKLVEAHGGEVGVDSVIGQGSTFWFRLPVVAAPLTSTPERS